MVVMGIRVCFLVVLNNCGIGFYWCGNGDLRILYNLLWDGCEIFGDDGGKWGGCVFWWLLVDVVWNWWFSNVVVWRFVGFLIVVC